MPPPFDVECQPLIEQGTYITPFEGQIGQSLIGIDESHCTGSNYNSRLRLLNIFNYILE